jgi:hypothetical protein
MATKTTPRRRSPEPVRLRSGANFSPKSQRKQVRKGLVRAAVTNKVVDAKAGFKERAQFYRDLRNLKDNRRRLSLEFARLSVMVDGLRTEVTHVGDRYEGVSAGLVEEALMLAKDASATVSNAAYEWYGFSRKKVYFTEAVKAA